MKQNRKLFLKQLGSGLMIAGLQGMVKPPQRVLLCMCIIPTRKGSIQKKEEKQVGPGAMDIFVAG